MTPLEVRPSTREALALGGAAALVAVVGAAAISRGAIPDALGGAIDLLLARAGTLAVLLLAIPIALAIAARPQVGVLLLALLVPYRGLLIIAPAPRFAEGFKEAITVYALAWALLSSVRARRAARPRPDFLAPLVLFMAVGAVSAAWVGGATGAVGLKVGFFYTLVLVICWLCPLSERERDRLVTILMINGFVTAAVGLAQQVVGGEYLVKLGYEWNTQIRTIGGLLRSFSTFNQPFPFAFFLTTVILVGLPVALEDRGRLRNQLFLLSLPVLVGGLVFSFVRGAWLALAVGLVYLAVHRYRAMLLAAPVLVLSLLTLPGAFSTAAFSGESLGQRQVGWTENLGQVFSAPLGNGIGLTGAAAEKAMEVKSRLSVFYDPDSDFYYQPDNQYFKVVYELGVLGLWFFVLTLGFSLAYVRRLERDAGVADRGLLTGIGANIVGVVAACVVATYFEIFPMEAFFWLLLGVASSCARESS